MRTLLGLSVVVAIAGCASDVMKGYVGRDISEVMVANGPPAAVFDMPDGRKAFQWATSSTYVTPTTTTVSGYGNYLTAQTYGGIPITSNCVYTYYARPNAQKSFTVVGFAQPSLDCE